MTYLDNYNSWLSDTDLDNTGREELIAIGKDDLLMKEAFTNRLAFGTAGMRGMLGMGTSRMNIYTVACATLGLARYIVGIGEEARGVLIGYDTRRNSFLFARVTARVLEAMGIKVFLYENVRPVPMISYGVRALHAVAGVMITASHNPKEYNGFKVYGRDGAQLSLADSDELSQIINGIEDYIGIPMSDTVIGENIRGLDGVKISDLIIVMGEELDNNFYREVKSLLLSSDIARGKDVNIIYTPIHGAGAIPVARMLQEMDIPVTVVEEQRKPDTEFSTVIVPNPEQPEALKLAVRLGKQINADAVIGTDPDCDRMGVAVPDKNRKMVLLTGNQTGVLLCDYVLARKNENKSLHDNSVIIKSIVTTALAAKVADSYGAGCVDVLTGFKFFGEKIKEWEISGEFRYEFGFEESYGYLAGTHARDKDAVSASMLFAEMVCYYKKRGKSILDRLEELYKIFGYYKDLSVSFVYPGLDGMTIMAEKMKNVCATNPSQLGGYNVEFVADFNKGTRVYKNGRVEILTQPATNAVIFGIVGGDWACIRPSGTEPKLKYYISASGESMAKAEEKFDKIALDIKKLIE